MSHSYSSNRVQLIFSTKERKKCISDDFQPKLWAYMAGVAHNQGFETMIIGPLRAMTSALAKDYPMKTLRNLFPRTALLLGVARTLIVFPLFVLGAQGQQNLYVDTNLPNAHPLKRELVEKLKHSGRVTIVTLPENADLILILDQTGRSLGTCASIWLQSECGHRGRLVLRNRQTGEEMWSEEKGGAWQWSGWSDTKVGRKLGNDLVKFLSQHPPGVSSGSQQQIQEGTNVPKL